MSSIHLKADGATSLLVCMRRRKNFFIDNAQINPPQKLLIYSEFLQQVILFDSQHGTNREAQKKM
jgi:hypothetical protein